MDSISDRQKKLLNAIITEFVDTAEAVGSINLLDKYDFKISSATIRNEMAELVIRGYLYKKHSSAGRIPTTKGWRFFVDQIKDELSYIDSNKDLEVVRVDTDELISTLTKVKDDKSLLIRQGLNFLSELSENATVALLGGELYYSGLSNLTDIPELKETENLRRILRILEDYYTLSEVFNKNKHDEEVNIMIGEEETGKQIFSEYSVIFSELRLGGGKKGFLAVIGPNRMQYKKIISAVKYVSDTIRRLIGN